MKIILYLSCILSLNLIFGQKKEIYREDFNNNDKGWSETRLDNQERFFRGGQYFIINEQIDKRTSSTSEVVIDTNEDFIIETSVSLNWKKEGSAQVIYGADATNDNLYILSIRNDREKNNIFIGKNIDGEWIGKWLTYQLKDLGVQNKIEIKKNKNSLNFYINNKQILSKEFESFFGNYIGVGCQSPQNVSFDYFVIRQDKHNFENSYYETKRNKSYSSSPKNEIDLTHSAGVYVIPVELNEVLKINFIFDSGASEVSISPDVALTLFKTGTIKESDWLPGAYYKFADGTSAKSARFKLHSVKIGNKIIYDVECSISNSLDAPMLLGQSVLKKFGKYTIDYTSNKLIIQ